MSLSPARRHRVAGGALALLVLGITTVVVESAADPSSASGGRTTAPGPVSVLDGSTIPWPEDGQSAVELVGTGAPEARGEQRPVPIASLAKVMTAHVILKEHPLRPGEPGPLIEVDRQAAHEAGVGGESTVPLQAGRTYSQRQLLELTLIPSGNNAARLLARWDSGSQDAFVRKMERTADELGMDRSTYTGASGIEPTTTSTAVDQVKLAREAMKDPVFREIVASRSVTVPDIGPITNTNSLLDTPGVVGIKTGSSTPAGGNLLWACEVPSGGTTRLLLGAVLHQRANTTPSEGIQAALESGRRLITGLRDRLSSARTER
ncbi:D-alanyl-D-alanine carboxypeptidase family protein [Streptomyces hydrogenans]|uniref:D-alanyl-D-alanine carboxypeptidase n=1 Tax=Streptomyces hydrogenans TaxID=1873719 RepID=A0ABQ3PQX0_9ACTN|nr:serine hydrolase [Streptomyces hydrogenans]GHF98893.1 D-alanyl-D-alanine carboxypeptidase [Streptomyces hydrogenans]GHI27416.1 D-alanyl-D-alanine carboxypeptidase [Streptomyces hydrogenans]